MVNLLRANGWYSNTKVLVSNYMCKVSNHSCKSKNIRLIVVPLIETYDWSLPTWQPKKKNCFIICSLGGVYNKYYTVKDFTNFFLFLHARRYKCLIYILSDWGEHARPCSSHVYTFPIAWVIYWFCPIHVISLFQHVSKTIKAMDQNRCIIHHIIKFYSSTKWAKLIPPSS